MRAKNVFKILSSIAVIAVLFTSCNPDTDDTSVLHYYRLGNIKGTSTSYSIVLDDKTVLYPANPIKNEAVKDGLRVFVEFSTNSKVTENGQDNYNATLYNMYSVLTHAPIQLTRAINDSLGNDPINVATIWMGGKYLNVDFQVFVGGASVVHRLNLAIDTIQTSTDTVNFILKHNALKDYRSAATTGLVSFDMSEYIKDGKKTKIRMKYENYSGMKKEKVMTIKADSVSEIPSSAYSRVNFK
jgi:hypothetical protein